MDINELPEEIREKTENDLKMLNELAMMRRHIETRYKTKKADVYDTARQVGINVGDVLGSQELGLGIRMNYKTTRRIDGEELLKRGVSQEVIEESTIVNHSKPFITRCNLQKGITIGITNANKRAETKGNYIVDKGP